MQRRLLANSVPTPGGREHRRSVGVPAVAESLGLTEAQAQIVVNALAAVSPVEESAGDAAAAEPGAAPSADAREADMHWLLLFLFVQMYSRPHVQARPELMDYLQNFETSRRLCTHRTCCSGLLPCPR